MLRFAFVSCREVVVIFGPVAIFDSSSLSAHFIRMSSVRLSIRPSLRDGGS